MADTEFGEVSPNLSDVFKPNDQDHKHTENKTMKAVVWEGHPYQMVVRHVPRPTITFEDDILVRVTTAAICGSDLHTYHGIYGGVEAPYLMGHEAIGIVEDVGTSVVKIQKGDRVVVPDGIPSGAHSSIGIGTYGQGDAIPGAQNIGGCQAEYVIVPDADVNALKVPSGTEHEHDYLMLSDIFCTAWTGITNSGFQAGDTVAIYGAGPVGLEGVLSALVRGASKVYSIDHIDARLEKAKSIGAIPIDLRNGDPTDQILKLEPAGIDRVLDMVGFECVNTELEPQENFVINNCVKLVKEFTGGINITGQYWGAKPSSGEPKASLKRGIIDFDIGAWWSKINRMAGGGVVANFISPTLLPLIEAGRASPGFVVDRVYTIDEAPEAYREFSDRKVIKPVIKFDT